MEFPRRRPRAGRWTSLLLAFVFAPAPDCRRLIAVIHAADYFSTDSPSGRFAESSAARDQNDIIDSLESPSIRLTVPTQLDSLPCSRLEGKSTTESSMTMHGTGPSSHATVSTSVWRLRTNCRTVRARWLMPLHGGAQFAERAVALDDFEQRIVAESAAAGEFVTNAAAASPFAVDPDLARRIGQRHVADVVGAALLVGHARQVLKFFVVPRVGGVGAAVGRRVDAGGPPSALTDSPLSSPSTQ